MGGLLDGFATIILVIVLGMVLAQIRLLDEAGQAVLLRLSFFVASPALMTTVLADADLHTVFSAGLVASLGAVAVTAVLYVVVARLLWRRGVAETVIGTLSSVYVNAGNLGIPVAAYALGDAALVAPMLLVQLLVMQPLALALLDSASSADSADSAPDGTGGARRFSPFGAVTRALRNPLTVGSLAGLMLAVSGWSLPAALANPLALVGAMAVPAMLLAYGVSLRLGPLPGGAGASRREIVWIAVLKMLVQPALAYLLARFALGLDGTALLAVTIIAALPTAQNIFMHATRYDRAVVLARDAIFVTTLASVPVVLAITALLT